MSAKVEKLIEEFKRLSDMEKQEMIRLLEQEEFYREVIRHSLREWDNAKDDAYNEL